MDVQLFLRLYSLAKESDFLGDWMVVITNLSSTFFAVLYLGLLLTLLIKKDRKVIPAFFGPFIAFILVYAIRFFYHRPRPFMALDIESLIYHEASGSLPSMHATSAFAIAAALYYVHKKSGFFALALAALTGLSRVMVGVHFPLDILMGCLLSLFVVKGTYGFFSGNKIFHQTTGILSFFKVFNVFKALLGGFYDGSTNEKNTK